MRRDATAKQCAVFDELLAVIERNLADGVSALELLAITANVVGRLAAVQDASIMSSEAATATITWNMNQGNAEVVDGVAASMGETKGTA